MKKPVVVMQEAFVHQVPIYKRERDRVSLAIAIKRGGQAPREQEKEVKKERQTERERGRERENVFPQRSVLLCSQ